MTRPTDSQLVDLVDEGIKVLERLRKHGPTVLARAASGGLADGYPTRSMGDGMGSGDGTSRPERVALAHWSNELVDQGHDLERSDPYARYQVDPVRYAANAMSHEVHTALRALRSAEAAMRSVLQAAEAAATDPAPVGSRAPVNPVPDCLACDLPALPRPHRGMCEPCFDVWVAVGRPDLVAFRQRRLAEVAARDATEVHPRGVANLVRAIAGTACALCGHDPACGRATAFEGHRPVILCHDDDHSCYHRWTVYGIRPGPGGDRPAIAIPPELRHLTEPEAA